MINYIIVWYGSWDLFYRAIKMLKENKINNWFISFEGYEKSDMYLCSKDPRGDDEGEIITCKDCFE